MKAEYLQRFGGIARLYGQRALGSFSQARVCVVGIGGGGYSGGGGAGRPGDQPLNPVGSGSISTT
ncbi:tRNA cyclic N6-threonylcarbamoyladenosine(37) synthase TcdA, partial [Aeromonas salmonicida]